MRWIRAVVLPSFAIALACAAPLAADDPPPAAPTPEQALERAQVEVERLEAAAPRDESALAAALIALGHAFQGTGRRAEGAAAFERAAGIHARVEGELHPRHALALMSAAESLRLIPRHAEARALIDRVLALCERGLTPDGLEAAEAYNLLGFLFFETGRRELAPAWVERGLAIRERLLPPDDPLIALSLNNLAADYFALGDTKRARTLMARSLAMQDKGPQDLNLALAHANMAVLLGTLGEHEASLPHFRRSLEIRERILGPDRTEVAFTLSEMANVLLSLGRWDEARPALDRAIAINEKQPQVADYQLVRPTAVRAALAFREGDLELSARLFERALEGFERALPPERPEVCAVLTQLGAVQVARGEIEAARASFTAALERSFEHMRTALAGLQGPQRLTRLLALRAVADQALIHAPRWGESGYDVVLRVKGMAARAEAVERRLALDAAPELRDDVARLRALEARLAGLANAAPLRRDAEARARWQAEFAALDQERESLSRGLAARVRPYRAALAQQELRLADIQAALAPDELLLDVLRVGGRYVSFAVRREGPVARHDLGRQEDVDEACRAFVTAVGHDDAEGAQAAGVELAGRLLAPHAAALRAGVRHLLVSPDGALAAVPLGALPFDGGPLWERLDVAWVASAQDLVPGAPAAPGHGAVLVGGVEYGPVPARGLRFAPLAHTAAEVEELARRWPQDHLLLRGAGATEAALRAGVVGRAHLHVATHGFVRTDLTSALAPPRAGQRWLGGLFEARLAGHDPRLLAGLVLAGANARAGGGEDDGILTALEAAQLDLRACRLVTLSACRTALGESASGEGVLGLVQGLEVAGVRAVVASLWDVDDASTRRLMGRLYDRLLDPAAAGGAGPAAALREAALWLRAQPGSGAGGTSARHWAAFVAYERR